MQTLDTKKELDEIIKDGKSIIKFTADWCPPCKLLAPIFEEAEKDFSQFKFLVVDVDKNPESAIDFEVTGIPTMVITENGKTLRTNVGFTPKIKLEQFLKG